MRIEKKLKQGLADLSRLLSAHYEFSLKARQKALLTIEPPIGATLYRSPPRLVTAAFSTPDHEIKGDFDFIRLANSLKTAFQKVVILSLVSSPLGNGRWAMRNADEKVSVADISMSQIMNLLKPEIASSHPAQDVSSFTKALVVWNLVTTNPLLREAFFSGRSVLEIIDHCVFVMQLNSDHVLNVYEQIRSFTYRRKGMRCSILLVGRGAEAMWEFVYERLSEIVLRFLGCDIGFLGWLEGDRMRLNPELFFEEGSGCVLRSTKARLGEMLYASAVRE